MAIVGVFIRENEAFLAYPKNGSTRQLNTILPPGVGEDTFFTDQESFRRAFDHITHFLEEREGIPQPEYILCVPDSFGMGDKTRLLQYAGKCGIDLIRMISKTLSMGLALSFHDGVEGIFWVGYEKDNDLLIGEYEYGDDFLEKLAIYIISSWRETDGQILNCDNREKEFMFGVSNAKKIYFVGNTDTLQLLEGRINASVSNGKMDAVQPYGEWNVPIGLAVQCAKLSGVCELDGKSVENFLALDTLSPYPLYVAWKDEMFEFVYEDYTIPTFKKMKLLNAAPDNGDADYTLKVYEKIGDRMMFQGSIPLQKESYKLKGKGDLGVTIDIDANSICEFSIKSGEKYLISCRADKLMQLGNTGSRHEEQSGQEGQKAQKAQDGQEGGRQELLASLLPVINNLSYGAKYSGEDNSYAKGMASIYDQTKAILVQQGIELIESTGVPFDVRFHYAVEHVTDPEMPPNTVKKIIQPGCMDHGEVIQPAYVVVAN